MRIIRKKKDLLLNRIVFLLNPFSVLPAYYSHRLGSTPTVPETIESLHAIPEEQEIPIITAAPVSKCLWPTFAGFTLFFLLILLIRLVLAFGISERTVLHFLYFIRESTPSSCGMARPLGKFSSTAPPSRAAAPPSFSGNTPSPFAGSRTFSSRTSGDSRCGSNPERASNMFPRHTS